MVYVFLSTTNDLDTIMYINKYSYLQQMTWTPLYMAPSIPIHNK